MARPFITMLALTALSAAPLSLSACSKSSPRQQACMDGRTRALTEGDFSGPILCDDADASFVLAGRTGDYAVYDYRYRYRPRHGAVDHGGQRILVFRGETYLGQYIASPPPPVSVSVRGSIVHFDTADSQPLDLSNGPPAATVLSGHDIRFVR
jgi:hypothetical protein